MAKAAANRLTIATIRDAAASRTSSVNGLAQHMARMPADCARIFAILGASGFRIVVTRPGFGHGSACHVRAQRSRQAVPTHST